MKIIVQIAVIFFPLFGFSQTDTIARMYMFGGSNNDSAEEIEATTDGGYIVIGATSSNSSGNTDAYLLKVDSMCNYEWSMALGGTNNDWGYSIKQTFDKGYIIAASSNSYGNGGYDAVLMKRDSLGNYVWRKAYGGLDWDFAYSVVQTYDSGYVFCGETYNNTNGFSDVYIVKTNPLGDTLWTRTFGGTLIDKGNSVIETSDSNIVVAGITNTLLDSTEIYVIKLSASGTLIWDSIYGNSLYENANAIIETVNGDYVITGTTSSFSPSVDNDFYLIRIDNNGILVWANSFGNPGVPEDDEAFDVYEEANGDLINVGATSAAGGGLEDATLFYINSFGNWGGIGPTFGGSNNEGLKSFTVGTNGDYCMAGYTTSFGNGIEDVLIIRLDTVYNGQDTSTFVFTDVTPLTISESFIESKFQIYPNPAEDYIWIDINDISKGGYEFLLAGVDGRIVKRRRINEYNTKIDLKSIQKGIYIYILSNGSEQVKKGKVVIY
jgi:hypothetical protein